MNGKNTGRGVVDFVIYESCIFYELQETYFIVKYQPFCFYLFPVVEGYSCTISVLVQGLEG